MRDWLASAAKYLKALYGPAGLSLWTIGSLFATLSAVKAETAVSWPMLGFLPEVAWHWWATALLSVTLLVGLFRAHSLHHEAHSLHHASTRLYQNRSELPGDGLRSELLASHEVWAMWPAGYFFFSLPPEAKGRIKRLILMSPNASHEALAGYAKDFLVTSVDHVRHVVLEVTENALSLQVGVRWHPRCNFSVVIGEPQSQTGRGWARVELLLPLIDPSARPSIKIFEAHHPVAFRTLVDSFVLRWKQAEEPLGVKASTAPDPDSLTIDSARYGFGDRWVDVRDVLSKMVVRNRLDIPVLNRVLGCEGERDPFKRQRKRIEVVYSVGGHQQSPVSVEERQRLILPLPKESR